jgi:hypothetical protein
MVARSPHCVSMRCHRVAHKKQIFKNSTDGPLAFLVDLFLVDVTAMSSHTDPTTTAEKNNVQLSSYSPHPATRRTPQEETPLTASLLSPSTPKEAPTWMTRSPSSVAAQLFETEDSSEKTYPVTFLSHPVEQEPYYNCKTHSEEDESSTADETEEEETIVETPSAPVSKESLKADPARNSDSSIGTHKGELIMNSLYEEEKKEDDAETSERPAKQQPLTDTEEAASEPLRTTPKPRKLVEYIRHDLWKRGDPDTVHAALQQLAVASTRPQARSSIARTGGLLAIVRAMEDHLSHAHIQIAACRALEKLALDAENEMAIAEIGGVDAVLGAMMCHFEDCAVQEAAWSTLWNLTCLNSQARMTIDTAGGMAAIVSCMRHHALHPKVQQNACGALRNLCLHHEERLQALVDAGGLVAIAAALQTHWKNPAVRKEASYALAVLLEPQFLEDGDM